MKDSHSSLLVLKRILALLTLSAQVSTTGDNNLVVLTTGSWRVLIVLTVDRGTSGPMLTLSLLYLALSTHHNTCCIAATIPQLCRLCLN